MLARLGQVKNHLGIKGMYSGNNRKSMFTEDFCTLITLMLARFYSPFPPPSSIVKYTRRIIKQQPWNNSLWEKTIFVILSKLSRKTSQHTVCIIIFMFVPQIWGIYFQCIKLLIYNNKFCIFKFTLNIL